MSKKRGHNEGSIFQERPGRWVASINLGYTLVDGKRRRVRKKFVASTRGSVRKKLTEALLEQQTGGVVPLQRESLGAYLTRWPDLLKLKGTSETTLASYRWIVKRYLDPS